MKRLLYLVCCLSISLQMFAQSEISELFPTLAGLERTNFTSYYHDDCCGESKSILITSPTEIDSIDGNLYLNLGGFFLREENNKVLIYSFAYKKDFVLYDWSLEVGDTLHLLALDSYSFPDIEYPVVVDYRFEYIEDENDNLISQKVPMGNITVREVSAITLLDGKEYKKWSFQNDMGGSFEYIENIGCLKGYSFMGDCYFNLIQPEAITVCYQGEHLVCASRNGQLLYQMSDAEMDSFGVGCKCLNNKTLNEDYAPMVVEGYSWNVVNRQVQLDDNNTIKYSTISEKIEGDSIINDITYKKLWHSTNDEMSEYEIIALVREDIKNQKVWAYIGEKEYLLYDFACEAYDTVTTLKSLQSAEKQVEEIEMTIKAIEAIEDLSGAKYNKYTATIKNQEIIYYERFGSENGWYSRSYDGITGGGINFMVCAFDSNDELLFKPTHNNELDEIENCYINETKTDIENVIMPNVSLKKVIHNGQLYIIHEGKIYNVMGVEMKNMNWDF